jgi:hypothetical protein
MEKNMLNEINTIRQQMGLPLLNENELLHLELSKINLDPMNEGAWENVKDALSKLGRYKAGGKIFGKSQTDSKASAQITAILDKQGNEIIKNLDKTIKQKNPEFPNNYISHIKENIGNYKYIFVSSHEEVRNALKENGIKYYMIYPAKSKKQEFVERYIQRGSPEEFVNLIKENWNSWIGKIEGEKEEGFTKVCMTLKNLEDELNYIEIVENSSELLKLRMG